MVTIDREWLAWAAGFVEGEGCFWTATYNGWNLPRITVAQQNPRPLVRLSEMFQPIPSSQSYDQRDGCWRITFSGFERCQAVVALLWVWLSDKRRDQAALMLQRYLTRSPLKEHRNSRKTHCPRGHEYSTENTLVRVDSNTGRVARHCRACRQLLRSGHAPTQQERKQANVGISGVVAR